MHLVIEYLCHYNEYANLHSMINHCTVYTYTKKIQRGQETVVTAIYKNNVSYIILIYYYNLLLFS